MATIQKRTSLDGITTYTATIRLKGYPIQNATFKRLTDAKKWIASTESAMKEGRHFTTSEAKKHTLSELIDAYTQTKEFTETKKARDQTQQLNWWKGKIGYLVLADVTPAIIEQCKDVLETELNTKGKIRSPATVFQYMTALSRMFEKYAIKTKKWIKENPVKEAEKPKINNDRVRFLDDDERAKLLTACKESTSNCLYLCVVLAISTGMRQGELMGLQWQDVNIKGGFLILNETKNGERRRVHLSGLGLELLRNHAKVRRLDTPLLFPSLSNPQQPIGLKRAWETALKRAEITNFHWHDLRHCTASYLAMNGASLVEIAEVLGHKTLAVTQRYAHLSDGHVSNVVASMNAKIFGGV